MTLARRTAAVLLIALGAMACKKDYYTGPTGPIDPATEQFGSNLRDIGVDLSVPGWTKTATGLYYRDRTVGTGATISPGDSIAVYYVGYFTDGRAFDSNRGDPDPFPVRLGRGRVIAGWEQGIPGMRVGGRRLLVIPSDLAYGEAGRQGIPPFANLVFEVDLETKY
jgi:peptidylprolyl isomerase